MSRFGSLTKNLEHNSELLSLDVTAVNEHGLGFGRGGKIEHLLLATGPVFRRRGPEWAPIDSKPRRRYAEIQVPDLKYRVGSAGEVSYKEQPGYLPAGVGVVRRDEYRRIFDIGDPLIHEDKIIRPAGSMQFQTWTNNSGYSDHLILREMPEWEGDFLALELEGHNPQKNCRDWIPFATDADGRQVVCDTLRLENGILLLVDFAWIQEAQFPVDIDPDLEPCITCWAQGVDDVYATARSSANNVLSNCTSLRLGQNFFVSGGGDYTVARFSMIFKTNCTGTVTDTKMDLAIKTDSSDTDFDVQIAKSDFDADYDRSISHSANCGSFCTNCEDIYDTCLSSATDVTWRNTSGISVDTYYTSPSMDNTYAQTQLNADGWLFYCVRSAEDKNNSAPTNEEVVWVYCCGGAHGFEPVLKLTGTFDCGENDASYVALVPSYG
jgi:hypothetical protein